MARPRAQHTPKRRRRRSDHPLRAFSDPDQPTDQRALIDALTLHAEQLRAKDEGRAPGLVARMQKLRDFRPPTESEVDHV